MLTIDLGGTMRMVSFSCGLFRQQLESSGMVGAYFYRSCGNHSRPPAGEPGWSNAVDLNAVGKGPLCECLVF